MSIKHIFTIKHLLTLVIFITMLTHFAHARKHGDKHDRMNQKPPFVRLLKSKLIPPHLVMRHMTELELSDAQKAEFKSLMKKYKSEDIDQAFNMQDITKELKQLLNDENWNNDTILKKAQSIMNSEQQLKLKRLSLALKVRALLTAEQRLKAHEIKGKMRERRRHRRQKRRNNDYTNKD